MRSQEGKKSYEATDVAAEKLFTAVTKRVWNKESYKRCGRQKDARGGTCGTPGCIPECAAGGFPFVGRFYDLLDNYEAETGVAEVENFQEKKEISDFLDSIMGER
jgi:hypothetical protein